MGKINFEKVSMEPCGGGTAFPVHYVLYYMSNGIWIPKLIINIIGHMAKVENRAIMYKRQTEIKT